MGLMAVFTGGSQDGKTKSFRVRDGFPPCIKFPVFPERPVRPLDLEDAADMDLMIEIETYAPNGRCIISDYSETWEYALV